MLPGVSQCVRTCVCGKSEKHQRTKVETRANGRGVSWRGREREKEGERARGEVLLE